MTERRGPSRDVGPRDKRADGAPSTQVLSQLWEEAGVVVAEGVTKDVPHAPFGTKPAYTEAQLTFHVFLRYHCLQVLGQAARITGWLKGGGGHHKTRGVGGVAQSE